MQLLLLLVHAAGTLALRICSRGALHMQTEAVGSGSICRIKVTSNSI
jgi:hypothetical protein